jgi:hypothetical protein
MWVKESLVHWVWSYCAGQGWTLSTLKEVVEGKEPAADRGGRARRIPMQEEEVPIGTLVQGAEVGKEDRLTFGQKVLVIFRTWLLLSHRNGSGILGGGG